MKNIYILDEYQNSTKNGIGTYLNELLFILQKQDVNICLISFNSEEKEFNIKKEGDIRRIFFPAFAKGGFHKYHFTVTLFLKMYIEDSSDNIFIFNYSPCGSLLKSMKEKFSLSKFIFAIHDFSWSSILLGNSKELNELLLTRDDEKVKNRCMSIFNPFDEEKRVYNMADAVLTLCDDAHDTLRNIYQLEKRGIHMIHNGLRERDGVNISEEEKAKIRKSLKISKGEKIILFVGRPTEAKGISTLLKSFCRVVKRHPKARLIIAGSISDIDRYTYLCSLSKQAVTKIIFTDQLTTEEMASWYKIADIGVLPTHSEQCSYSGIEMLMYGLAIVASDGFGVRNMFLDNYNAKIAKIGNNRNFKEYETNLYKAISELLQSKDIASDLSKNAVETYKKRYTIEIMHKKYEQLFNEI